MNTISATHYSSGCGSGWTLYFDESFRSENQFVSPLGAFEDDLRQKEAKMADDEDLSMVSDASSGPPHNQDDNEESFHEKGYSLDAPLQSESSLIANEKTKKKANNKMQQLEDKASSPVFMQKRMSLPKKESSKEDFSMGFSATHVKKHFGLFQSTLAKNSASGESGGFHGGKLE